jgi:hypothetical protein
MSLLSTAGTAYVLHTPQVPPFLLQCLQYLQFLQALHELAPVQVAIVPIPSSPQQVSPE